MALSTPHPNPSPLKGGGSKRGPVTPDRSQQSYSLPPSGVKAQVPVIPSPFRGRVRVGAQASTREKNKKIQSESL